MTTRFRLPSARHPRSYGREDFVFNPLHYLALLERKIAARIKPRPLAGWALLLLASKRATLRRLLGARMEQARDHRDGRRPRGEGSLHCGVRLVARREHCGTRRIAPEARTPDASSQLRPRPAPRRESNQRINLRRRKILAVGRHVAATLNYLPNDLVARETRRGFVERGPAHPALAAQRMAVAALLALHERPAVRGECGPLRNRWALRWRSSPSRVTTAKTSRAR